MDALGLHQDFFFEPLPDAPYFKDFIRRTRRERTEYDPAVAAAVDAFMQTELGSHISAEDRELLYRQAPPAGIDANVTWVRHQYLAILEARQLPANGG